MKVTLSRTYEISEIPSQVLDILQKNKKTTGCLDPIWFDYVSTLIKKSEGNVLPLKLAREELENASTRLEDTKSVLSDWFSIISSYIEFLENQETAQENEKQAIQDAIEKTQRTIQDATESITTSTSEEE